MIVKKYGNRRLYDTEQSRYITLENLADSVRRGSDVRVVDAKSGDDLTTATLAQILVEGRGAARLLPQPLLVHLVRMGDDALAEFFGQYVTWALEMYLQAKQGVQSMGPLNPFALAPYGPAATLSRLFGGAGLSREPPHQAPPAPAAEARGGADGEELAALRRELEELKRGLRKKRR